MSKTKQRIIPPKQSLYTTIHPLILPIPLIALFPTLVADPIRGMTLLAPITALLQGAYCLTLPAKHHSSKRPSAERPSAKRTPVKRLSARHPSRLESTLTPLLFSLTLTPLVLLTLILFGAPLTTHHPHTLLLALHLSVLSTPQLFSVLGLEGDAWREELLEGDGMAGGMTSQAIGTFVGAWLGAVPIPLDWDE
ncbi:hypothetical protein K470DRAFT_256484 [Piedraia hortae CBS 480.64]|uniref:Glycosylphosphatidylinositol anchor biosynthesis protein 11 n=1 Tax=Piedraia hortae CBS 480.64 TaxID=1314780 RepID=A0A6A7C360_9PEZI|nr:hypothetical protein K470DRAFT_256484 [Piedraia hortae CBS 480.64]